MTYTNTAGVATPGKVGGDRSVLSRDAYLDMALRGQIYIAGVGLEGTALTGRTSLADTTPDIVLKSPTDGTAIIPIHFGALMTNEGGAAPDWHVSLVTADIAISTAGTTVTPQNVSGPNGGKSVATLQTAPTMAAFTNAQNVRLDAGENTLDNLISVEGATTVVLANDLQNSQTKITWNAPAPLALKDGASFMVHFVTGTTGSQYEWRLIWAEVPVSDI